MVFACVVGLALAGCVLKFCCSSELVADLAIAGPGPLTYENYCTPRYPQQGVWSLGGPKQLQASVEETPSTQFVCAARPRMHMRTRRRAHALAHVRA